MWLCSGWTLSSGLPTVKSCCDANASLCKCDHLALKENNTLGKSFKGVEQENCTLLVARRGWHTRYSIARARHKGSHLLSLHSFFGDRV